MPVMCGPPSSVATLEGVNEETPREAYREAWERWQAQLDDLHAVFLEGKRLHPAKMKGLLNREARAKEQYDQARLRLLGLSSE